MRVGALGIYCRPKHFAGVVIRTYFIAFAVLSYDAFDADFFETLELGAGTLAHRIGILGTHRWLVDKRERKHRNQRALKERYVA